MKWFSILLASFASTVIHADSHTFSKDRLEAFYEAFGCEEKNELAAAGVTSPCSETFNNSPFPPTPPGSTDPAPKTGYLTLVISNQTGQPDNQVYLLGLPAGSTQFFTQTGAPFAGALVAVPITASTFSADPAYSIPLSSLQKCSTGAHDYLVYIPPASSDRMYFSIGLGASTAWKAAVL